MVGDCGMVVVLVLGLGWACWRLLRAVRRSWESGPFWAILLYLIVEPLSRLPMAFGQDGEDMLRRCREEVESGGWAFGIL